MNITTSGSDYVHTADAPPSSAYLHKGIKNMLEAIMSYHAPQTTHNYTYQHNDEYPIKKSMNILDIGCGNGSLARYLTDTGFSVVGIDPSESAIDNARHILPGNSFYCMGVYDDPKNMEEHDFDVVIATEVIEHLFYPRELLRFARAKLKKDGILILSTPYHGYIKNLVLSLTGKWDAHHTPLWDGGHIKFWSRTTLSQLLNGEGFEVARFAGCGRIPLLWKSMLLVGRLK